jgi:hypothetical protein
MNAVLLPVHPTSPPPHLVAQVAGHAHEQAPHQRSLDQRRHRHVVLTLAVDLAPAGQERGG